MLVLVFFVGGAVPTFAQTSRTVTAGLSTGRVKERIIVPESAQPIDLVVNPYQEKAVIMIAGGLYHLGDKIGYGSEGAVYEAYDSVTESAVAVKLSPLSLLAPTEFTEKELQKTFKSRPKDFLAVAAQIKEISKALQEAGLNDVGFYFLPKIVETIYLDGQYTGDYGLNGEKVRYGATVMPLAGEVLRLKNYSLMKMGSEQGLQVEAVDRVQLARSVQQSILAEISALAEIGYGHFDVNPSNIALDKNSGKYSLIDWGATRKLKAQKYNDLAFHESTFPFTAPEIPTSRFQTASTLYSLGISLMWILDGEFVNELSDMYPTLPTPEFLDSRIETLKKNLNASMQKDLESVFEFIKATTILNINDRREALTRLVLPKGITQQLSKERGEAWVNGERPTVQPPKPVFEEPPATPSKPKKTLVQVIKGWLGVGQVQCIDLLR